MHLTYLETGGESCALNGTKKNVSAFNGNVGFLFSEPLNPYFTRLKYSIIEVAPLRQLFIQNLIAIKIEMNPKTNFK